ncbi:MAG: amidase family protein [Desulfobacterales bacterium]|nr:amidase family protein [Desulfobacterales bacterium]
MSNSEICFMTATEMAERIRTRDLSCRDFMEAHLNQIDRINPMVNAIVTRVPAEQAMDQAAAADEALARGEAVGPLHGLPIAHKDLVPNSGMRTTWGSPIYKDFIKDSVIWNIEQGQVLTGPRIGRAEKKRTELYHRVREFMETHEFLVCPVNQVPPFDVNQQWIEEINGVKMASYIDWMRSCYYVTITGLPAISVPCGFTPEGLPVGMQIVDRPNAEFSVLQLAHAFECATGFWKQRPAVVM